MRDKLTEVIAAAIAMILTIMILGLTLLVTGWIWLGVISVWQMIF